VTVRHDPTSVNALMIRRRLGRSNWTTPTRFGPNGWRYLALDGSGSVIVTMAPFGDDEWVHASIGRAEMPTYADLKMLHTAVFGDGWAYQVFAPPSDHINLHEHALHLWGRNDGLPALPNFTEGWDSI
jgi:hypothetical protein